MLRPGERDRRPGVTGAAMLTGVVAARAVAGAGAQLRLRRNAVPLTERWRELPVAPRGQTPLGISFRPRQATALGLQPRVALAELLEYPFELIRLAAYWDDLEPAPGRFETTSLDRQINAAQLAGKQIIVCVGAIKAFGYPEYFVPAHRPGQPLPEGRLITPGEHSELLRGATEIIGRIIERYRDHPAIIAWQVEHEGVDSLGLEHSWRLAESFVRAEVAAARAADPGRPVLLNGFLPTSAPVRWQQWWRTRDQGDSLAVAQRLADITGMDFYPRHALAGAGPLALYLDGSATWWRQRRARRLLDWAARDGHRLMIAEGQAEPWEAVTTPPSPEGAAATSCRPEDVIGNYNQCLSWAASGRVELAGYLFWGAEYWLHRAQRGDPRYLSAFSRLLKESSRPGPAGIRPGQRARSR